MEFVPFVPVLSALNVAIIALTTLGAFPIVNALDFSLFTSDTNRCHLFLPLKRRFIRQQLAS